MAAAGTIPGAAIPPTAVSRPGSLAYSDGLTRTQEKEEQRAAGILELFSIRKVGLDALLGGAPLFLGVRADASIPISVAESAPPASGGFQLVASPLVSTPPAPGVATTRRRPVNAETLMEVLRASISALMENNSPSLYVPEVLLSVVANHVRQKHHEENIRRVHGGAESTVAAPAAMAGGASSEDERSALIERCISNTETLAQLVVGALYAGGYAWMALTKVESINSLAKDALIFAIASYLSNYAQGTPAVPVTREFYIRMYKNMQRLRNTTQEVITILVPQKGDRRERWKLGIKITADLLTTALIGIFLNGAIEGAGSVAEGMKMAGASSWYVDLMYGIRISLMFGTLTTIGFVLYAKFQNMIRGFSEKHFFVALLEAAVNVYCMYLAFDYTMAQGGGLRAYQAALGIASEPGYYTGITAVGALNLAFTAGDAINATATVLLARLSRAWEERSCPTRASVRQACESITKKEVWRDIANSPEAIRLAALVVAGPTGSPGMELASAEGAQEQVNAFSAAAIANFVSISRLKWVKEHLGPREFRPHLVDYIKELRHLVDNTAAGEVENLRARARRSMTAEDYDSARQDTRLAKEHEENFDIYEKLIGICDTWLIDIDKQIEEKNVYKRLYNSAATGYENTVWGLSKIGSGIATVFGACMCSRRGTAPAERADYTMSSSLLANAAGP